MVIRLRTSRRGKKDKLNGAGVCVVDNFLKWLRLTKKFKFMFFLDNYKKLEIIEKPSLETVFL